MQLVFVYRCVQYTDFMYYLHNIKKGSTKHIGESHGPQIGSLKCHIVMEPLSNHYNEHIHTLWNFLIYFWSTYCLYVHRSMAQSIHRPNRKNLSTQSQTVNPYGRHPLRLHVNPIDFLQQFRIGPIQVTVDKHKVK